MCLLLFLVPPGSISVVITQPSDTPMLGTQYTLRCGISKISGLVNTPTASWFFGSSGVSTLSPNVSELTLSPLRTSQAGRYTCRGSLITPASVSDVMVSEFVDITVQSKVLLFLACTNYYCIVVF